MSRMTRTWPALALAGALAGPLGAQGAYVEHEAPMVKGLAIANVNGRDYLLVCNTPNNSLEIYRTDAVGELSLETELPTGLSPVSVVYDPNRGQIYTVNHIGDSVTRIEFPTGVQPVATLRATNFVGDAPIDLAMHPTSGRLNVLLSASSQLIALDATTLAPAGPVLPSLGVTGALATMFELDDLVQFLTPPGNPNLRVMKQPRRIIWENGRLHILAFRGDNGMIPGVSPALGLTGFSFDLFSVDTAGPSWKMIHNELGSANMGLAVAQSGNLFVAGSLARNDVIGSSSLAQQSDGLAANQTGFVESHLYEISSVFSTHVVDDRDLNVDENGNNVPLGSADLGYADGERVSMPSDVVLLESGGAVQRVFVTAFHSDRIIVLDRPPSPPFTLDNWPNSAIDLSPLAGYSIAGPRALAIKGSLGTAGDPGARLYCLNRLDNTVSVFDPTGTSYPELLRQPLQSDPTPAVIRGGRVFLYGARQTSGGHMVSCASCHIDGGTDGLAWRLGEPTSTAPEQTVPPYLVDGVGSLGAAFVSNPTFPNDKELKVTQNLHGLVNHPVNPEDQIFFSNQPYHWRGDKATFNDFNEAFVTLMGAPDVGSPGDPKGLTPTQMSQYHDFVNQLMYPPNPEQPYGREYDGSIGSPDLETDGVGAKRGMKLFHIHPLRQLGDTVFGGRSCVGCHSLPDGSSNTITLLDGTGDVPVQALLQPLESSAMRSLNSREGKLPIGNGLSDPLSPTFRSSTSGLTQGGLASLTINDFLSLFFSPGFDTDGVPGLSANELANFNSVVAFARSFDAGVAPSVGPSITVTSAPGSAQTADPFVAAAERQARMANCGLTAYERRNGVATGYYYDVTRDLYVDPIGLGTKTRSNLMKNMGPNDVAILQGVHVGSERRVAVPPGTPAPGSVSGPAPSSVVLEPMMPPIHWREVPQFTKNWSPPASGVPAQPNDFVWGSTTPEPISLRAMREYQNALLGATSSFGLPGPRHEAPRRFRVSGDDIRHGAKLLIGMPNPIVPGTPPPYASNPIGNTFTFELDLHPTLEIGTGNLVWETTVEAEPILLYMLMNGGTVAPGVSATFLGDFTQVGSLDPGTWNQYYVRVQNETGAPSVGFWSPITIQ